MAEATQIQCYLFLRRIGKGFLCKSNWGPQTMIEVFRKAKFFSMCISIMWNYFEDLGKELQQQN